MQHDLKRVPYSRCLACHKRVNTLGTGNRAVAAKPEPGDVVVCIRCGAVMRLDKKLKLRGMTQKEIDEITRDREWMDRVAKMVERVHLLKKHMPR